jgi:hypothetical protein
MHDPRLSCICNSKEPLLQCMYEAAAKHRAPSIYPISLECKKKLGFNFVELLWYARSWPWSQSERGKSNLGWKKNTSILSNYNELVDILSSGKKTSWAVMAIILVAISGRSCRLLQRIWQSWPIVTWTLPAVYGGIVGVVVVSNGSRVGECTDVGTALKSLTFASLW